MHARVVRFTDVSAENVEKMKARVNENDGPPPGVDSTGLNVFFDESQGTLLFVGFFEDEEKMRAANEVFEQMDASETPGTRASVDQCEIVLERSVDD